MEQVAGVFYAAAVLLAVAGIPKVTAPANTANAVRSVGLPASWGAVRALGAAEVVIGVAAVALGGPVLAALVALQYLAFAGFVVLALRRGGAVSSCGCFGKDDTPATYGHLGLNVGAAAIAVVAAIAPVPGVLTTLQGQPWAGVPFLLATGVCTWLAYLVLTVLPTVVAAVAKGSDDAAGTRNRSTA